MKFVSSGGPFRLESERFRMLVAGVTDYAIYMLSPEGIVSSWNAGAQRFKGYTGDEIIGQHFSGFYTDEDRANGVPQRALQTALDHGKFEDEGWRVRKDGTCFWASVVIDPIRDPEGTLIGFAKITRDITERKRASEKLHSSEERFRLLVQGVTDYAIYMLSPAGVIINWNAGAKRIKGYDEHEVIDTHFSRFYIEETLPADCRCSPCPPQWRTGDLRAKDGACARMVRGSGRMWLSTPSEVNSANWSASPKSRATLPNDGKRRRTWRPPIRPCSIRKSSKPSEN
jgi:PAS domain S-box-containing protein